MLLIINSSKYHRINHPSMSLNHDCSAALFAKKKPTSLPTILEDILSDKAPRPYSVNAFFDFVSHRHCTESLDFIVKVQDYHNLYTSLQYFFNKKPTQESTLVREEWGYLMSAFVSPGSPCELNLPSSIRNELLSHDPMLTPPRPDHLESAVRHTCEMLTDNILIPFLREPRISNSDTSPLLPSPSSHEWAGLGNSFTTEERPPLKRSPR